MKVFGVDPGNAVTGYGVVIVEGNVYRALDFGCIRPPAKAVPSRRRLVIFESLCHLLDVHQPDAMAIESQFVLHNVQTALKLGMVRGIAALAATQRQIPVYEYAPSKAKQAVTGRGGAPKEQVQGMMQRLLNLTHPPTPEDASDALALAICHIHAARGFKLVEER